MEAETRELLDYLDEVLEEYEKYLINLGNNGLSASLILYYRDEIQEILDELKYERELDLQDYWLRVRNLDELLRQNLEVAVNEIGYDVFKRHQITNDPPLTHWWWYINRQVSRPQPPPKAWEFWKK